MPELTIACRLRIPLRDGETPEEALARANTYLSGGYELVMLQLAGFNLDRYDVGCPRLEPHTPFPLPPPGGSHDPDCPYRNRGECDCHRSDPTRNPELEGGEHGAGQD